MTDTSILVVDDEEMMLLFITGYLSGHYPVHSISDAREALEWLNSNTNVGLIIMDLTMPEMDGFEFLTLVKNNPLLQDTPVLVLSGSEQSDDGVRCLRMGAADFMTKPFNPEELLARVDKVLGRLVA